MYSMKKLILGLLAVFALSVFHTGPLMAQPEGEEHVKWTFTAECVSEGEIKLTATAEIDEGWHLYDVVPMEGLFAPAATRIYLDEEYKDAELVGGTTSKTEVHEEYEPALEMDARYYENEAVIEQVFKVKGGVSEVKFFIDYQVCDDRSCMYPLPEEFSVSVPEGCVKNESGASETEKVEANEEESESNSTENSEENSGWWALFLAGFGGGLFALLTPCVFPMIPMTVNFFVKQSSNRSKGISNALLYGACIILIYTGLGFTLTKFIGVDVMNLMAASPIMNIIFFIVFVVFGISFLGAFEITLPSWIVNKSDAQADKGGLLGIFFMAFTLAVVSFSCTGPIIGSQLVLAAQSGHTSGPLITMFGFSVALAVPFMLFAIFPSWLANMPKSGGWLNSVKVVLGLLEIALAFKFLSTADLVSHTGLLTREIFISVWVIVFAMIGFYLLGKLKFSHDTDLPYISVPRTLFAMVFLSFAIYMVPGLFGAPLKLLSGLAPPRNYVEDNKWMRRGMDITVSGSGASDDGFVMADKCPNGLPCTKDYYYALEYAKKVNKPVFVDFTGHSCVNCRKMEDNVWVDPKIDKILRNNYIVTSLYVDDKEKLPESEREEKEMNGKKFKVTTVGNKWTYLEITKYQKASQPWYVLLTPDEEVLIPPVGYTPDVEEYEQYLLDGLKAFEEKSGNGH